MMNGTRRGSERYTPHLLDLFSTPHVRTGHVNGKHWGPTSSFAQGAQKVNPSPFYPSFSPTHMTTGHSFVRKGRTQQLPICFQHPTCTSSPPLTRAAPHSHEQPPTHTRRQHVNEHCGTHPPICVGGVERYDPTSLLFVASLLNPPPLPRLPLFVHATSCCCPLFATCFAHPSATLMSRNNSLWLDST